MLEKIYIQKPGRIRKQSDLTRENYIWQMPAVGSGRSTHWVPLPPREGFLKQVLFEHTLKNEGILANALQIGTCQVKRQYFRDFLGVL